MKRDFLLSISAAAALCAALLVPPVTGCSASRTIEGVRVSEIPNDLRDEYELFALRCSKCHGLARPLNAGDKSDEFWQRYVTRMRRQPGSGIALADEPPILRFLHYYSARTRTGSPIGVQK
jgi:hypothetical protein